MRRARLFSLTMAAVAVVVAVRVTARPQTGVVVKGTAVIARAVGVAGSNAEVAVALRPIGTTPPPPGRTHPKMIQQNKRFAPHLLVVQAGTIVDFPNLDPFFHNAFSLFEGKRFDLGLYEGGTTKSVTFGSPGVCFVFCNIHPEMSAVVVVVDTPYFAVTNKSGEFLMADVPPGRYALTVWHERATGGAARDVMVGTGATDVGTIRLTETAAAIPPHTNKYGHDYIPTPSPGTGYIIIK